MEKHYFCRHECQQAVDYGVNDQYSCNPRCVYLQHLPKEDLSMANGTPQLPDPDAPWLKPEDVKRETTYVYRVRYLTNQIEVLVLLSKSNHKLLVRDPAEGSADTWIEGRDVYDTFDAAQDELVRLNRERVELVAADLQRAKDKLDFSLALYLDDNDEEEDDEGLDTHAPHQVAGGDNIWA